MPATTSFETRSNTFNHIVWSYHFNCHKKEFVTNDFPAKYECYLWKYL